LKARLATDLNGDRVPFEVLILNTIGELERVYGIADISFVGGSLIPIGGHNLLEPASFGCPILFGPYTHNFVLMSQLLIEIGGGRRVQDLEDLFKTVKWLLSDPQKATNMGARAKDFVETNRGALTRIMDDLRNLM
jgi:3-deoxy-D-manno-octulosonic-acid transferase